MTVSDSLEGADDAKRGVLRLLAGRESIAYSEYSIREFRSGIGPQCCIPTLRDSLSARVVCPHVSQWSSDEKIESCTGLPCTQPSNLEGCMIALRISQYWAMIFPRYNLET